MLDQNREQQAPKCGMPDLHYRSGEVRDTDPFVAFLYQILRDHLPAGEVESILKDHVLLDRMGSSYCNGWLAKYAQDVAARMHERYHLARKVDDLLKIKSILENAQYASTGIQLAVREIDEILAEEQEKIWKTPSGVSPS